MLLEGRWLPCACVKNSRRSVNSNGYLLAWDAHTV
nr:MAG TPA: Galanin [Caudoviricetes sp.]